MRGGLLGVGAQHLCGRDNENTRDQSTLNVLQSAASFRVRGTSTRALATTLEPSCARTSDGNSACCMLFAEIFEKPWPPPVVRKSALGAGEGNARLPEGPPT